MVAGANILIRIWRITFPTDDEVGGAQSSGTAYGDYYARMQGNRDEQLLLQQGLETERTFSLVLSPGNRDIRERDEIEVISPIDHPYYGDRFRIVSIRHSDFNTQDQRSYTMLTLSRSVFAHVSQ
jgi:hypothetical protein